MASERAKKLAEQVFLAELFQKGRTLQDEDGELLVHLPDIKSRLADLIDRFYEKRGSDWLDAAEFTLRRASGTWPHSCYEGRRKKGNPQ